MRNFDQDQDLTFQIAGEQFSMRTVRPEVLAAWEDAEIPTNAVEALKVVDDRIEMFLATGNGQHEKWKALREKEDNAVTLGQLRGLLEWMVEVQSAYPTEQPSPSVAGRGKIAASSTGA